MTLSSQEKELDAEKRWFWMQKSAGEPLALRRTDHLELPSALSIIAGIQRTKEPPAGAI